MRENGEGEGAEAGECTSIYRDSIDRIHDTWLFLSLSFSHSLLSNTVTHTLISSGYRRSEFVRDLGRQTHALCAVAVMQKGRKSVLASQHPELPV